MEQKKKHFFQIRKTEFQTEKQELVNSSINLQLLESTCIVPQPMNRNNIIETNNLIYLNGSFITFYNFFQSNKQFAASVSEHPPIGMAGTNSGKIMIAVVTQSLDKKQLCIAMYSLNDEYVPTHTIREEMDFIDICFLDRTLVLCARKQGKFQIYILKQRMCLAIDFPFNLKRIVTMENKGVLICDNGLVEFDEEKNLTPESFQLQLSHLKILDYFEVESQTQILLTPNSLICFWAETSKSFTLPIDESLQLHRFVKVGRNILAACRNEILLVHFVIGEEEISKEGEYQYCSQQKIKGGIVNINASTDEMHLALGVEVHEKDEVKVENFIFNMSSLSRSSKLICPFTRMMPMGFDSGPFTSLSSLLSSNIYLLIGSKISNLVYTSTIEKKKVFNLYDVPRFMAAHPLGYQFVCGFEGVIKFYNRIEGDMQEVWKQNYVCTAASYSNTGILILSIVEDSYTSLLLYDCYNFKKQKVIPISYLKLTICRIDWVENNSSVVLFSQSEIIKLNISNGEKSAEFRERQQNSNLKIRCIDFDANNEVLLAGAGRGTVIMTNKINQEDTFLQDLKTIRLKSPFSITHVKIIQSLKVVFLGTACGCLLWTSYPLRIKPSTSEEDSLGRVFELSQGFNMLKIHNQPISFIGMTPNHRFLLINVRGNGYFTFRVRWVRNFRENQANFVFHELGNPILNTIDFSSCSLFEANKQKLKIALQKRKTCFNDLEQFRRECDSRIEKNLKAADLNEKQRELKYINEVLDNVEKAKVEKKDILADIEKLEEKLEDSLTREEDIYEKKMLRLYNEEDAAKEANKVKQGEYEEQINELRVECEKNLKEITEDLWQKFSQFRARYGKMQNNLKNFQKRAELESQEEFQIRNILVEDQIKKLEEMQIDLNRATNNLSVKITHNRKQNQRFCNRKGFLEHKIKFFQIQNENCLKEAQKLEKLKVELERNLKRLEHHTLKKEHKLKMNVKANTTLQKYKDVYENLTEDAKAEMRFIVDCRSDLDTKIVQMQKELTEVASKNEQIDKKIKEKGQNLNNSKQTLIALNLKQIDIMHYVKEMNREIEIVKHLPEEQKAENIRRICQFYFEERKVQSMINPKLLSGVKQVNEKEKEAARQKQTKILSELKDRKKHVLSNFNLLKDYNERAIEEINLNLLQIQAQNYKLISECNSRKEQTFKKKRMLHELIDSVKETQIYLDEMRKEDDEEEKKENIKKHASIRNSASQIPFVIYEKNKEEQFKQNYTDTDSTKAGHSRYQFRKVLDVKKISGTQSASGRRIMTAVQKKGVERESVPKPQTAAGWTRSKRSVLKSAMVKNKSFSKPTMASYNSRSTNKPSFKIC